MFFFPFLTILGEPGIYDFRKQRAQNSSNPENQATQAESLIQSSHGISILQKVNLLSNHHHWMSCMILGIKVILGCY